MASEIITKPNITTFTTSITSFSSVQFNETLSSPVRNPFVASEVITK